MFKLCTLIRLSLNAENRQLRVNKHKTFELLDMMIRFITFLQKNLDYALPIVGVDFVIEAFKLIRCEVCNDNRQIIMVVLLDFLDSYLKYYVKQNILSFSPNVVGLESFLIFEIIDTSKCLKFFGRKVTAS